MFAYFFWNKNIHMGSYTQVTTLKKVILVNFPNQRSLKIIFLLMSQIYFYFKLYTWYQTLE